MPDGKIPDKIELKIPEDVKEEWLKTGFTCTAEYNPSEGKFNVTCEPAGEAEDKFVGKVLHKIIRVRGNILGSWKDDMPRWIKQCIMGGGLPMFRTRYAGARWDDNMVMAICYGDEEPPLSGGFFKDVPEEDVKKMEEAAGDWRWIVEKYGDEELKIYVHEKYKPPKIGLIRLLRELAGKHEEK